MKRIPVTLGALSLLLLLTVTSCTSTLSDEPTTDAPAISFMPAAETRAVVEGGTLPDDFLVWGGYSNTLLFEGETVHPNGSYENGMRYWVPGTYNFYAVYPATIKDKKTFSNGSLTVKDFDCSATGNNAVDLMTAIPPSITYEAGTEPQPVAMEFQHELARVNVTIKTEEAQLLPFQPKCGESVIKETSAKAMEKHNGKHWSKQPKETHRSPVPQKPQ